MFRDMNNAALGGIAGVIGDALAQYETVMRQVSDIRGHALEKTSEIEKEIQIADPGQIKELQAQIKEIEEKSENKILELSRRTVLPIPAEVFKKRFSKACPHCGGINEFEMLDKHGETRTVICEKCGGRFNAHIAPGYNRNNTLPPARFDRSPLRTIPPTVLSSSPAPNKSGTAAIPVTPPVQNNEVSDSEGNGADVGTYTFRENLLSSKEWIFTDRKPDEAKKLLITTQSLIRPEDLQSAISAIVSTDEQLRKLGQRRTPNALLYNILRNLKSGDVTNTTFRKFLKIALYGKCFHFGAAKFSLFASEYYNDLDSSSVIKAYLRGCVFRLARLRPLSGSDAPWVSKLLLGDLSKDWEETTKELLLETLGGPNEKVLTDL